MADIRDYDTRMIIMKIDNGYIKEFSGIIKYKIVGDCINDFYGRILYKIDGEWIKNFNGVKLLKISDGAIKDFYGRILGFYDGDYLKRVDRFITHIIDGYLSKNELMALLTILYLEDLN